MSARGSGSTEGVRVERYSALVITESPQTVLASTGNLIFVLAVKSQSVALVVVAHHVDENYSNSHIPAVVSIRSLLIHNPMRLGIMYNSLADSATFCSISWTWMMSACLFIAYLTFGYVPLPRSTLACVYLFECASFCFPIPASPIQLLSGRPSPLSVIPFTSTLNSVRVSKGKQEILRCCPLQVFYFLRGFGYAYLQQEV